MSSPLPSSFQEVLMLEGCPHCGDREPKIVTINLFSHHPDTHFVGEWDPVLKSVALAIPTLRIISCRPPGGV